MINQYNLDNSIFKSLDEIEERYKNYLISIKKSVNDANKKNAKAFYNQEISQYVKSLENTYKINGLANYISIESIRVYGYSNIEFEKGFLASILDIFSFGYANFVRLYSEQMCQNWKSNCLNMLIKKLIENNQTDAEVFNQKVYDTLDI